MHDRRALYGLVLAGGKSRRMGQDKATLQIDGQTQLQRAFDTLQGVTDKQFVSTRPEQQDDVLRKRFPQIVDRYDDMGPVAGILSALEFYPDVDWLVVACDLPRLDASTLTFLIEHQSSFKDFTAFRSSYDGLPEPLCAIYKAESVERIREFVSAGMTCPRKMLIRSDTELLSQPDPTSLDNVNTPEDLATVSQEATR